MCCCRVPPSPAPRLRPGPRGAKVGCGRRCEAAQCLSCQGPALRPPEHYFYVGLQQRSLLPPRRTRQGEGRRPPAAHDGGEGAGRRDVHRLWAEGDDCQVGGQARRSACCSQQCHLQGGGGRRSEGDRPSGESFRSLMCSRRRVRTPTQPSPPSLSRALGGASGRPTGRRCMRL